MFAPYIWCGHDWSRSEVTEFKPDGQDTATSLTLLTSKSVIMNSCDSRDRKIELEKSIANQPKPVLPC